MSIPVEHIPYEHGEVIVMSGGQVQFKTAMGSVVVIPLGPNKIYVRAIGGEMAPSRTYLEVESATDKGAVLLFEERND